MASSFLKTGGIIGGGDVGQYQLYDDLQARLEADTVGMASSSVIGMIVLLRFTG
jgi:hypothetical protein